MAIIECLACSKCLITDEYHNNLKIKEMYNVRLNSLAFDTRQNILRNM